jgi:hypothetical protein
VYLQLYTWKKPFFWGMYCCSCSVFTVCATANVFLPTKYVLFFYISTFCSMCAVPDMAVFWSSLILSFSGVLLRYYLNDFVMVPVAPVITSTLLLSHSTHTEFLLWGLCILKPSQLLSWSNFCLQTSINVHVPFLLSQILMSSLLLGKVLSVHTYWFLTLVTLPSWLVLTDFGTWWYQCLLSNFTPTSLDMSECSWVYTLMMSFFVLFFCQFWACWYDVLHSLIKLFTDSAFAVRYCL